MQQYIIENKVLYFTVDGKRVPKAEVFTKAKEAAGSFWVEPISTPDPNKGSSVMVRFGQEAYARGEEAAGSVARRWLTLTAIYKELHALGVEATLQDSRLQKAGGDLATGTYVPACALFINQETRAKNQGQGQAQTRASDEDLLVAALAVDEDRAMAIIGDQVEPFTMAQRARLRMLVERGTQAKPTETKAEATETKTESDTSTGESTESYDSEAIPF